MHSNARYEMQECSIQHHCFGIFAFLHFCIPAFLALVHSCTCALLAAAHSYFIASMMLFNSSGISGIGARDTVMRPSRPLRTMLLTLPDLRSFSGKSSPK